MEDEAGMVNTTPREAAAAAAAAAGDPQPPPQPPPEVDLRSLTEGALAGETQVLRVQRRPGVTESWPQWADRDLVAALSTAGIAQPWQHQVEAARAAFARRHVALATGTASGKSIGYWLPALTRIRDSDATVLYCTPTKALAQDQLSRVNALHLAAVEADCYDGDTPQEVRPLIRRRSNYVLTNPDMLHHSILPRHEQWTHFLRRLQFVILDESHTYRGVFGSHMAAIVRRLRRLAAAVGAEPTFILASATLANPGGSAADLVGAPVEVINEDSSARGPLTLLIHDADIEAGGSFAAVADVLATWTAAGVRSLGFIRSRSGAESLATAVQRRLPSAERDRVAPYRGGLLPEERRIIEGQLRSGELRCVATTNALELGVDISGLDAVALCGWPGTHASFRQQIGRAGRGDAPAVALLAAQEDPLDQFYVQHPQQLLDSGVEATVFDPNNPYVLLPHLAAAIAEKPLRTAEACDVFGPLAAAALGTLQSKGAIRQRGERWFWVARTRASSLTDLRHIGGTISVMEQATGRVLGTVDSSSAPAQVHAGAVYVHLGAIHLVEDLDLDDGVATVRRADPGYTTVAQSVSDLQILHTAESRSCGSAVVHFGDVEVGSQVVGYLRRRSGTGEVLGSYPLDLPRQELRTRAVWWTLPNPDILDIPESTIAGAAHAAEHAAIGVLPALATCDRWDIGGLSTELHPDTGQLTVFVYDGHPGGAGFARQGYREIERWLSTTRSVVSNCACDHGCPRCIQSPKCGNGNNPLDKRGAIALLDALLTSPPGSTTISPTL